MKKSFVPLFLILIVNICCAQKIDLNGQWKFKKGDDMAYKNVDFKHSDWESISPLSIWEQQGHSGYNGYAWYRFSFFLSDAMIENSFFKDSLKIVLGKIDDCDQVYINGELVGQNAGKTGPFEQTLAWDKPRCYKLGVNNKALKWNAENVIAVRVYDQGGGGGMYDMPFEISMVDVLDLVTIDNESSNFEFKLPNVSNTVRITSRHNAAINGSLKFRQIDLRTKKNLTERDTKVELLPNQPFNYDYQVLALENTELVFTFAHDKTGNSTEKRQELPYILTPIAPKSPRINAPAKFGASSGKYMLFQIPCSGNLPIKYTVNGLPEGLNLDPNTGIITGRTFEKGSYNVSLRADNALGYDTKQMQLVLDQGICLTPPMGWNSWNCWGLDVDENKVKAAAQELSKKLKPYGWSYVNIDDGWQAAHDADGNINPNEKFENMKLLCDEVHAMGLKIGIYSSPGPTTCGGYTGSYKHEQADAKIYAAWGMDYLKYDWCSYNQIDPQPDNMGYQQPYADMYKYISAANRDIVYSICQYGMNEVWRWGAQVGGNLWRTTGDITDTWESMSNIGFKQIENQPYNKPGQYNDPDMLVIGKVGWGPNLHHTRLSCNEQYTHITLWSMLGAPLLLGCDLSSIDAFTLNLITNNEVLAIDQDPLCVQGTPIYKDDKVQLWVKPLANGKSAVAVFNLADEFTYFNIRLSKTQIGSNSAWRDLWRQQNLGKLKRLALALPPHGCYLFEVE